MHALGHSSGSPFARSRLSAPSTAGGPVMQMHWEFFKEQDRSFGVFYPLHYVIAAFDTPERAEAVCKDFVDAGFDASDVASTTGSFVAHKLESMSGSTWLERFKIGFASFLGTELGYIADDRKLAERGAGFLFIYTPDDTSIDKVET